MSALEGFYTTWNNARTTYGEGTPQTGEQYDNSPKLTQMATDLEGAAPGSRWTGAASEAYDKANKEHREIFTKLANLDQKLAAEVTNSANAVNAGRTNLESLRQWVQAAEASVPPGKNGDQIRMAIAQKGLAQLQEIVKQSNSESNTIGGRIAQLKGEFEALGNQRFGPKQAPGDDPLGGEDETKGEEDKRPEELGAADSEALQNGELTAEQRDRLIANTTLSPEQQTALNEGSLTLPPQQMAYLQGYSRAFGDKTPGEIKAVMDNHPNEGGRVADVFQLASNPNIKTGLPETQPPSLGEPSSGGRHALPDGIQKVLDGPLLTPLEFGPPEYNEDGTLGVPEITTASKPISGLNEIADIVQSGNRDLQVGTALDSGLFEKSQQLLQLSNDWPAPGNDPMADVPRWHHQMVDPTLQNMFNAVNKDELVIHDALVSDLPTVDQNGQRSFLSNEGRAFLDDLTQHQWQDDGLAAGGLFDWVEQSAASDASGHSAEAAHALAEYTSNHSDRLLNLPGTESKSLGEVNPELTRDWARAMSPYFDDMVGANHGDSSGPFPPLDPDGGSSSDPTNTRKLMSVLQSDHPPLDQAVDPNAAPTSSQIVAESVQSHMERLFDRAADSVTDQEQGEKYSPLRAAGRLQAAMDLGLYDERFEATEDEAQAQKAAYEVRTKTYEAITTAAGLIPQAGPVTDVGGFLKDFIFGESPGMPGVAPPEVRDMFPWQMHMAAALAEDGAGDPARLAAVREFLVPGGGFDVPDASAKPDEWNAFYDAINGYVSEIDGGIVNDMTDHYWRAYTAAIMNTTPPPPPGR